MRYLFLFIFAMTHQLCWADIYMEKDQKGHVVYTDMPTSNEAIKVQVTAPPAIHEVTTTQTTVQTQTNVVSETEKKPYTVFGITTPLDQATLQNEDVIITFTIDPPLQTGDKIQVFLDGKPSGPPAETNTINIGRIDRGTHTVQGAIVDANQKVLKTTQTITLYVHYAHLGSPTTPTPP